MNPNEVLRIVDAIHRDRNIDKEIVFQAIEAAYVSAAKKHYGDEAEIVIAIDREEGSRTMSVDGQDLDPEEVVGRIGAQTAKQVIIQKIREAERDALYDEYQEMIGQMVGGTIQRNEGGAATVSLGNVEALLPRSEQIPGESHHPGERVRATVFEVRKQGSRVKVLLSRTRAALVARLFEQEIPEIADSVIAVKAMSREPGYRSKVAVSSTDPRVDCVGACVGVRGNRIKNIVDELAGERIDIVRYNDDPQVLITNALQPAEIEEVILCQMMGRAIVLVREDQLSLAIGRRGQNVRLASKLCGWDIEIMTREELEEQIERAVAAFSSMEGVSDELAEALVGEGYLSYDDLSVIEPDALMEMGGLTAEQADQVAELAEEKALEAEQAAASQRRREKQRQAEPPASDEAADAEQVSEEVEKSPGTEETAGAEEAAAAQEQQDSTGDEPDANQEAAQVEPEVAEPEVAEPEVAGAEVDVEGEVGEADEESSDAAPDQGQLEPVAGDVESVPLPESDPPAQVEAVEQIQNDVPDSETGPAETEPSQREAGGAASP